LRFEMFAKSADIESGIIMVTGSRIYLSLIAISASGATTVGVVVGRTRLKIQVAVSDTLYNFVWSTL